MKRRVWAVAVVWLAALPATVALADGAAPFLWEVQGPKARHYLLGSVHMLPASAHPLPESLDAAYAVTGALVLESDLAALASPELQGRMLGAAREMREGGLKARIGERLYGRLQKHAEMLGMPTPVCDTFRAWFCALTLELFTMQQAGFDPEFGIDRYFHVRAQEDGRPIGWLEEAQQQLTLFSGMSDAVSRQFLAATVDEVAGAGQAPEVLHRIWRTGDVAALTTIVNDLRQRYPDVHVRLLAERNRAWLPVLLDYFADEVPVLVVVGAAHLVGVDGVPELLEKRGLKLRQVAGPIRPAELQAP
jgi:uncharacterized protein